MALLTVPVARALVQDLLDAMTPSDAVIVLQQLHRRYAPRGRPALASPSARVDDDEPVEYCERCCGYRPGQHQCVVPMYHPGEH